MPGTPPKPLLPVALGQEGEERLVIEWNDGHRSTFTWSRLRAQCPCASCREERTKPADPFRVLSERELQAPRTLRPRELAPVGRYAYKIVWNDGHDTGLYTFESLRALCECPECTGQAKG